MRMSGGANARLCPLFLAGIVALGGVFTAPCQSGKNPPEIEWRTDFDEARKNAASEGKLLFVVVHQAGEPGNEAMLRSVYQQARFKKALRGHVVALCCHADARQRVTTAAAFGVEDPDSLATGERKARSFLFGMDTVITPQQLILHPDGSVLWHSVRQQGLQQVLRGIKTAERRVKMSDKRRHKLAINDGVELAKRAARDDDQYAVLATLVRHCPTAQLWKIFDRVEHRTGLSERLLRDAMRGIADESSRRRLAQGRSGRHAPVVEKLMGELDVVAEPAGFARDIPESLEILGKIDLKVAQFGEGETHSLADAKAGLTVLWLFLPDDKTHAQQVRALRPVVEELKQEGVQFLGLAATLEPAADLERVGKLGFPFATGTFRYKEYVPLGGMKMFPGALVVDREGNILYRTGDDAGALASSYTDFASWVRGLLRSEHVSSLRAP